MFKFKCICYGRVKTSIIPSSDLFLLQSFEFRYYSYWFMDLAVKYYPGYDDFLLYLSYTLIRVWF